MILITGGAGYIGSHTSAELDKNQVIILDNLITGHKQVADLLKCKFIKGDLSNFKLLNQIFKRYKINAVMHFAASSLIEESQINPVAYYKNNVINSLNLVNAMTRNNVKYMIFSSSASVYGEPTRIPIDESHQTRPTNNYGCSKLIFEKILESYDKNFGLKYISLRYFNTEGAHPTCILGEDHKNETHLIPLVLKSALGKLKSVTIFGTDYSTRDGTCIRDYIHVTDLALAHILAINRLRKSNISTIYNLGNEKGFSVKEVIDTCIKVTKKKIKIVESSRRAGDPSILIASSKKIKKELKWKPKYSDINNIIESAWKWHKKNPNGYKN